MLLCVKFIACLLTCTSAENQQLDLIGIQTHHSILLGYPKDFDLVDDRNLANSKEP
jgi:hypothetical protein